MIASYPLHAPKDVVSRLTVLLLALAPYALLSGYDALFLHERARRVPRVEQALHAGLAVSLLVFLYGVFAQHTIVAVAALGVLLVLLAADELGFHRLLPPFERRIHAAAALSLFGFVVIWCLYDR